MRHPIHRVVSAKQLGTYVLRVGFEDNTMRDIDFEPVLDGELYGPLRDPAAFARVKIDPEIRTLVWDCGADFDPAILHDWPKHLEEFKAAAKQWRDASEDRRELAAAKKRNPGKPGTPLREAAKELGF